MIVYTTEAKCKSLNDVNKKADFGRLDENVELAAENMGILLEANKEIGWELNPEKTKCMIMSPDQNIVRNGNIKIGNVSFEEVEKLKYLVATVTNINDAQEEIKRRINMGNACYYLVEKLLSSCLLTKKLKVRIYKTVILPFVTYDCETWTLTLREEQRLRVLRIRSSRSFLWILDPTSAEAIPVPSMQPLGSISLPSNEASSRDISKSHSVLFITPFQTLGMSPKPVQSLVIPTQRKQFTAVKQKPAKNPEPKNITCTTCGKIYKNRAKYEYHLQHHAAPKKYHCPICNKGFFQQNRLRRHSVTHNTKRPFKCDVCNKTFKQSDSLNAHKKRHIAPKQFVCDACGYATISKLSLKMHKKRHTRDYKFTCELCGKGYYTNAEIRAHMASHAGEKHQCEFCGKGFSSTTYLRIHQRTHDQTRSVEEFVCDICGRKFMSKQGLRHHKRRHAGDSKFICDVCGKSIGSKNSLLNHRLVHTGEKPFNCAVCSKSFRSRSYLKDHIRAHNGEKPHKCTECGKSFTQRSTLVIHMRYHTGQRPYKCHLCNKGFVTKTLMITHQKSH
ncbi:hypothetical protein ANN_06586 [Periplaneta americana]|uniref:C2H2-type domain-containing protein n=2 Tax=Periplaneta americana TaxID=6978 RepID=A0ABQ8TE36_PERAM|nr:hypothetical protein ANN_06586 [Periplaneta americana]